MKAQVGNRTLTAARSGPGATPSAKGFPRAHAPSPPAQGAHPLDALELPQAAPPEAWNITKYNDESTHARWTRLSRLHPGQGEVQAVLDGLLASCTSTCLKGPYRNSVYQERAADSYLALVEQAGLPPSEAAAFVARFGTESEWQALPWLAALRARLPTVLSPSQKEEFADVIARVTEITQTPRAVANAQVSLWENSTLLEGATPDVALRRARLACDIVARIPLDQVGTSKVQLRMHPTLKSLSGHELDALADSELPPLVALLSRRFLCAEGAQRFAERYGQARRRDTRTMLERLLWCFTSPTTLDVPPDSLALVERLLREPTSNAEAQRILGLAATLLPDHPERASSLLETFEANPQTALRSYFCKVFADTLPELATAPDERISALASAMELFSDFFYRYDPSRPFVREIREELVRAFTSVLRGTWKHDRYFNSEGISRLPFLPPEVAQAWMEDDVSRPSLSDRQHAWVKTLLTPQMLEALRSHTGLTSLEWNEASLHEVECLLEGAAQVLRGEDALAQVRVRGERLGLADASTLTREDLGPKLGVIRHARGVLRLAVSPSSEALPAIQEADAFMSRLLQDGPRAAWKQLLAEAKANELVEIRDEDSPDALLGSNKLGCQSAGGHGIHGLAVQLDNPTVKQIRVFHEGVHSTRGRLRWVQVESGGAKGPALWMEWILPEDGRPAKGEVQLWMQHAFAKAQKLSNSLGRPVPLLSGVSAAGFESSRFLGGAEEGGVFLDAFTQQLEQEGFVPAPAPERLSLYPCSLFAFSDNLLGWTRGSTKNAFNLLHRLSHRSEWIQEEGVIDHAPLADGTFDVPLHRVAVAVPQRSLSASP